MREEMRFTLWHRINFLFVFVPLTKSKRAIKGSTRQPINSASLGFSELFPPYYDRIVYSVILLGNLLQPFYRLFQQLPL